MKIDKILIAIATEANVCNDTMMSIYNMKKPENTETTLCIIHSYNIADGRNQLVDIMLQGDYDYIFFVDSDVVLPVNALDDLYHMQWYFCTGTYPRKELDTLTRDDPFTTLYRHAEINKTSYCPYFMPFSELPENQLTQVDCCGFGCVLLRRDLFEKLDKPYFFFAHEECGPDGSGQPYCIGEDMYFCRQVVQKGLEIWAHGNVICGHVGNFMYAFRPRDWKERIQRQQQEQEQSRDKQVSQETTTQQSDNNNQASK